MSLLKQDTIRNKRVNQSNINALLKPEKKFEAGNNKKYKVKSIVNSTVYDKEAESQLSSLYYLVLWKGYLEEENIWELLTVIIYL